MKLSELLCFNEITIQCHDNPDADSISSGYALYRYFESMGKMTRLVYSGRFQISKPNLLLLIEELSIPLTYVESLNVSGLLITVDCQYGAGNVKRLSAEYTAIIDHHQQEIEHISLCEINPLLGSCSTLVWRMLEEEGFKAEDYPDVSTALYYGLMSDTNNFTEIRHPLDRDMMDTLAYDTILIRKLKTSNLTLRDLEIAGIALIRNSYNRPNRFSVIKTHPCDPNVLGFISDLAIQVDAVDVCIVYNETPAGIKYSVRSCVREVMASELAGYLSEGIGSGGGHKDKAGGFIKLSEFNRRLPGINCDDYLLTRLTRYYGSFEAIDSSTYKPELNKMNRYKKRALSYGYVRSTDVLEKGTPMLIRTLECDFDDLTADDETYIVIGIKGEVYPIGRDKFEKGYVISQEPFELKTEYFPHIRNKVTGRTYDLRPLAKKCISKGTSHIYALRLEKNIKVFTNWDKDTYMLGRPGDYLAVREDDHKDIYVISQDVFGLMYEED